MARHTQILQTNACLCYITGLCHLCPVGAQMGAAGRRKVAWKGLRGPFRAILSFSVVRSSPLHHASFVSPCVGEPLRTFNASPSPTPDPP